MAELKETNPCLFWDKHCQLLGKDASYFSHEFKALFMAMTNFKAHKRPSIAEIKASKWYNGATYSKKEVFQYMKGQFGF